MPTGYTHAIEKMITFGSHTSIAYSLGRDGMVRLRLRSFDEDGRLESQGSLCLDKDEVVELAEELLSLCK